MSKNSKRGPNPKQKKNQQKSTLMVNELMVNWPTQPSQADGTEPSRPIIHSFLEISHWNDGEHSDDVCKVQVTRRWFVLVWFSREKESLKVRWERRIMGEKMGREFRKIGTHPWVPHGTLPLAQKATCVPNGKLPKHPRRSNLREIFIIISNHILFAPTRSYQWVLFKYVKRRGNMCRDQIRHHRIPFSPLGAFLSFYLL